MAGEFISFYFHYKLSRKIPFTTLSGNIANVNFVTENNSIIGLDITIQGPMELGKAQDESDALAFVLSDLISIKSQKYTIPSLSGFEADDVHGNRHFQGSLVFMWDIEGAPANLENIDMPAQMLISSDPQKKAQISYLAKAVVLNYQHFPDHSLIELFKIIEDNRLFPLYYKYYALRNVLAHSPAYISTTIKYFLEYFNKNTFDYLRYDLDNKIIILNLNSNKTINQLNSLARELMKEIRIVLKVP
jgi:hypothetical protein